jgi:hypothetical protein
MTSSLPSTPFVSSRRIRFLTQLIGQDNTFIYLCFSEPQAGVFGSPRGVSTLISRIDRAEVEALLSRGIVEEATRSSRGVRYRRSSGAWNARERGPTAAERRRSKFLEAERFFKNEPDAPARAVTVNLGESPLGWLSRRRDANGRPFLSQSEVDAGERLRADFERAQLGPSVTQDWRRFLTPGAEGGGAASPNTGMNSVAEAARQSVMDALAALGPGLSDAALRTCCFLEGLETVEAQMAWSARSGKIVLKIALQRLANHYEQMDSPPKNGEIRIWQAPSS